MKKKRVVITGMGTINPCGNTVQDFWDNLKNGRSGITKLDRFDIPEYDSLKCKIGGEVKNFDPTVYGRNRDDLKKIKRMDPFVQFALAASDEAIKDSGLLLLEKNPNMAVIMGNGMGGLTTYQTQIECITKSGINRIGPFTIPTAMPNAMVAQISIRHRITGPSYSVNSACASSLNAIILACKEIMLGDVDVVITGGSEADIVGMPYVAFINMQALTNGDFNDCPTIASRPFDAKRSGFVIAEGAGVLILEELEHAINRGANIYGEIIGYGMTSDAYDITAPTIDGPVEAIQSALKNAGVGIDEIDYINAHGTSTMLNDKNETTAIKTAFGERAYQIPISSTKSMTGHLLGGAGAIETIACMMTIKEGIIHPTINYENQDPECDLYYVPNKAIEKPVDIVMKNSLGFGGHNVSIILKKY